MTQDQTVDQKQVAYYSAAVTAWFTTSLEHDKSLLTLSAGGIGLHLTLLTTVGLKTAEALVLYIGAIICFVVSLLAVLRVFRANQKYIEDIIGGRTETTDPTLAKLDSVALIAFAIGVILTAIVAISAAIQSYADNGTAMTDKSQPQSQAVPLRESFNGATSLQPSTQVTKSSTEPTNSLLETASSSAMRRNLRN